MRPMITAAAILALGACSRGFGGGGGTPEQVVTNVNTSVDSTLRVATTQLMHHGYKVSPAGENSIVTAPRAIPAYLVQKADSLRNRQWILQVNVSRTAFLRGTRLAVMGYVVPPSTNTVGSGPATAQRAIPVTNKSPLFQEVRAVSGWIADETRRK